MYFIYRHINPSNGYPFYVGLGKKRANASTYRREYERAYVIRGRSRYWMNYFNKYGRDIEIMCDCGTLDEARIKEKYFISLYGKKINGGLLVNLSDGGDCVLITDEHRQKLSQRMMGNTLGCNQVWDDNRKKKASEAMKERIRLGNGPVPPKDTPEIRKKKSEAAKRYKHTLGKFNITGTPKRIKCIETKEEFPSIHECVRKMFGWNRAIKNSIILVLKGRRDCYKKFHFIYA